MWTSALDDLRHFIHICCVSVTSLVNKTWWTRLWGHQLSASISPAHTFWSHAVTGSRLQEIEASCWATLMHMLLYKRTELFLQPRCGAAKERAVNSYQKFLYLLWPHSRSISKITTELWKRWVYVALFFLLIVKRCREDSVPLKGLLTFMAIRCHNYESCLPMHLKIVPLDICKDAHCLEMMVVLEVWCSGQRLIEYLLYWWYLWAFPRMSHEFFMPIDKVGSLFIVNT